LSELELQNVLLRRQLELTSAALAATEKEKDEAKDETERVKVERDQKLEHLTQKVRKLAKLLKSTMQQQAEEKEIDGFPNKNKGTTTQSADRVSRMPVVMNLRYRDKKTGLECTKEVNAHYSGPLVNSKPHGSGMLRFESGDMYLGEFNDGRFACSPCSRCLSFQCYGHITAAHVLY
jgi:hypothetical protein